MTSKSRPRAAPVLVSWLNGHRSYIGEMVLLLENSLLLPRRLPPVRPLERPMYTMDQLEHSLTGWLTSIGWPTQETPAQGYAGGEAGSAGSLLTRLLILCYMKLYRHASRTCAHPGAGHR
jgi:hypothetical protein